MKTLLFVLPKVTVGEEVIGLIIAIVLVLLGIGFLFNSPFIFTTKTKRKSFINIYWNQEKDSAVALDMDFRNWMALRILFSGNNDCTWSLEQCSNWGNRSTIIWSFRLQVVICRKSPQKKVGKDKKICRRAAPHRSKS